MLDSASRSSRVALLLTLLGVAHADLLPNRFVLQKARARLASPWRVEVDLSGEDPTTRRPLKALWRIHPARREIKVEPTPKPLLGMIWTRLFLEGDPSLLARDLRVSLDHARLDLLGDHVCHVIGHPKGPQVYFDQDNFAVLRVLVPGPDGGLDVELTRWEGPPMEGRFPRRIRVREARRWILDLWVDRYQQGLPTPAQKGANTP